MFDTIVNFKATFYGGKESVFMVLCDFGEARLGPAHPHEEIQPDLYKAPEIIMQTGWSHSVDIWNAACMVCSTPCFSENNLSLERGLDSY